MARTGLPGVAIAEGSTLGRAVAGTVSRRWLTATAGLLVLAAVAAAWVSAATGFAPDLVTSSGETVPTSQLGDPEPGTGNGAQAGLGLLAAIGLGWVAAEALYRHARARLGGVNGDVMGALGETTAAVTLLTAAVLLA
jgi:adenosylcobinamide-GDP ribazoletransferase